MATPYVLDKERIEQVARGLSLHIWLHCNAGSEYNQEEAGKIIAQVLTREIHAGYTAAMPRIG